MINVTTYCLKQVFVDPEYLEWLGADAAYVDFHKLSVEFSKDSPFMRHLITKMYYNDVILPCEPLEPPEEERDEWARTLYHEMMHAILSEVEGLEALEQYDNIAESFEERF